MLDAVLLFAGHEEFVFEIVFDGVEGAVTEEFAKFIDFVSRVGDDFVGPIIFDGVAIVKLVTFDFLFELILELGGDFFGGIKNMSSLSLDKSAVAPFEVDVCFASNALFYFNRAFTVEHLDIGNVDDGFDD